MPDIVAPPGVAHSPLPRSESSAEGSSGWASINRPDEARYSLLAGTAMGSRRTLPGFTLLVLVLTGSALGKCRRYGAEHKR